MDRRNLVVRPPFESMAVLRYTARVQHVPDNKGDALRVVFSASQRDRLVACGYELVDKVALHMPSDRLPEFVPLRNDQTKRRRFNNVDTAGAPDAVPEAQGGPGGRAAPEDGPGVDTLVLPSSSAFPGYTTPQQLCDIVELGFWVGDTFYTPLYRWPKVRGSRNDAFNQQHPKDKDSLASWNTNWENRMKEYYNLIKRPNDVYENLPLAQKKESCWPSADHLAPDHASFATRKISKQQLRLPLPPAEGQSGNARGLFTLVFETVRERLADRHLRQLAPF